MWLVLEPVLIRAPSVPQHDVLVLDAQGQPIKVEPFKEIDKKVSYLGRMWVWQQPAAIVGLFGKWSALRCRVFTSPQACLSSCASELFVIS